MKLYRVDGRAVFNADKEDALEDGRAVAERIATLLEASDA